MITMTGEFNSLSQSEGFVVKDDTAASCRQIHSQIRGFARVSFDRYLSGLCDPAVYECGSCGKSLTDPEEDFR